MKIDSLEPINKLELLLLLKSILPNSQFTNIDLDIEPYAIRFNWLGKRIRITTSFHADTCEGGMLVGDIFSQKVEKLINTYLFFGDYIG